MLVEDQLSADAGTIVAHEVGHALGLQHRPSDRVRRGWLMYPTFKVWAPSSRNGTSIFSIQRQLYDFKILLIRHPGAGGTRAASGSVTGARFMGIEPGAWLVAGWLPSWNCDARRKTAPG